MRSPTSTILGVVSVLLLALWGCQQLPTEPEPIDLSEELPVAVPDTATTDEDVPFLIDVLANDSSLVGDDLTLTAIEQDPTEGAATVQENQVLYNPTANFSGIDSLVYTVSGSVLSNSAPVYIIVRPVNDPPVANNDTFRVAETFALPKAQSELDVLANDFDIDGDRLTILRTTEATNGQVEIEEDGRSLIYTPNPDYVGDDGFRYTIQDGAGGLDVADVLINVDASNDPPVAADDAWAVREDETLTVGSPGVLANDIDEDGDDLSALLESGPQNGTLNLMMDGSFTYEPNPDYSGPDSFSYRASDGASNSEPAQVAITVLPVNDDPFAVPDTFSVNEDSDLNVTAPGVLANDIEPEGGTLQAILVSTTTNGVLTFSASGAFNYRGNENYNGPDFFDYQVTDGTSSSQPARVYLEIAPVNDPPVAAVDSYIGEEDQVLVVEAPGVLANDTDIDRDVLSASLANPASNGSVVMQSDGSFTYTPNEDFAGIDGFTYRVSDGEASTVAAVSITINAVNDRPNADDDAYSTPANIDLEVEAPGVLANDSDNEGERLIAELVTEPEHGDLDFDSDGSFSYRPDISFPDRTRLHIRPLMPVGSRMLRRSQLQLRRSEVRRSRRPTHTRLLRTVRWWYRRRVCCSTMRTAIRTL